MGVNKKTKLDGLNKPRSRDQHFTKSESKLLDQLTLEITEAWSKDLKVLRKYMSTLEEASRAVEDFSENYYGKFPELNEFLQTEHFRVLYDQFGRRNETINSNIAEILTRLHHFEESFKFERLKNLVEELEKVKAEVVEVKNELKEKSERRGIWKRICKMFRVPSVWS